MIGAGKVGEKRKKDGGFSLLEIVTVITIIGIISGLLVYSWGLHRKAIRTSKTLLQFSRYEKAIKAYCKEYGDWPSFFADEELICLSDGKASEDFIKILSGKNPDGKELSDEEKESFNPQGRSFHTFSADEFYLKDDGTRDYTKLSDAFNNKDIYIIVENPFDDDVIISKEKFPKVIQERINGDGIKTQIAIFSITEDGTNTIVSNFTDKM